MEMFTITEKQAVLYLKIEIFDEIQLKDMRQSMN